MSKHDGIGYVTFEEFRNDNNLKLARELNMGDFKTKQESMEFRQDNQVDLINEARNKMDSKHYIGEGRNDCDMSEQRAGRLDRGEQKACTKRLSVSALILENHRMVDSADERLGLILCTLLEKLDGDGSANGLGTEDSTLPCACIPLLQDMVNRQQNNAEVIERILDLVEGSL